ncbi:hypothetical protein NMY22_g13007 [Coprinellus aureogranulatus]|nr:hypothetical protein NMY22_g13007 [Coprinellus aureogranulatus]
MDLNGSFQPNPSPTKVRRLSTPRLLTTFAVMNSRYDYSSAAKKLQELSEERSGERIVGCQLADWSGDELSNMVKVVEDGTTRAKIMVKRADAKHDQTMHGSSEAVGQALAAVPQQVEVVWHVQGILTLAELPPFMAKGRLKDRAKFLRQAIRLSGLDTAGFNTALQNIGDIVALFSRSVSNMQPMTFIADDEHGAYLELSNRFFSTTRDRRGGPAVDLSVEVDPNGVLSSLAGERYYHGEENAVMYLERSRNRQTGKASTLPVDPVTFKKGDIVEAQFTFMLIQIKRGEWKLIATLRCVTLLEGGFTQACIREALQMRASGSKRHANGTVGRPSKRRYGHDLDDNEGELLIPVDGIAQMELDSTTKEV